MSDILHMTLACAAGALFGGLYFAGLWWTVRRSLRSGHPALLLFSSAVVRAGLVMAGFHTVAAGKWQALLGCLVGFVGARLVAVRMAGGQQEVCDGD